MAPDEIKQGFFILLDIWWELYQDRYHRVVLIKHEAVLDVFYTHKELSDKLLDWIDEWEKSTHEE